MANPWMDPTFAREWMVRMGAGHPQRDQQIACRQSNLEARMFACDGQGLDNPRINRASRVRMLLTET